MSGFVAGVLAAAALAVIVVLLRRRRFARADDGRQRQALYTLAGQLEPFYTSSAHPGDLLEQARPKRGGLKTMLEEVEKWIILDALREHGNNKTQTAETLQISREGLHKKIARFGLS